MNIIQRLIGAVLSVAAVASVNPAVASASSVSSKVGSLQILGTSFVILNVEPIVSSGRPGCHNGLYVSSYALDVSTNKGRALLSTLQAALLANKTVHVTGGTSCTNTGSITLETVQELIIYPT